MGKLKSSKIGKILNKRLILSSVFFEKDHDIDKAIILAGTGRSGTTWLGEILMNLLNYRLMFEPFNPTKVNLFKDMPNKFYIPPNEDNEEYFGKFEQILTGSVGNRWINQDNRVFKPKGRIIKTIRANLFLKWLRNNFPSVPIVFILRHPCAVVLSRYRKGWAGKDLEIIMKQDKLIEDFLNPYIDVINGANTTLQKIACIWCIENYVPLNSMKNTDWILINYEDLVLNPEVEINKILKYSKIDLVVDKDSIKSTSSLTVKKDSAIIEKQDPLKTWKTSLTQSEIKEILGVVEGFSLNKLYNENVLPNRKV